MALSITPDELDLRETDGALSIHYTVSDDDSGATTFSVRLATPGGECLTSASQSFAASRLHEDSVAVTFGRYGTAPGVWQVCQVGLCDAQHNCRTIESAVLSALGLAPSVRILATPDTVAPTLVGLSLSTNSIDLSTGNMTLAVQYQARDARSGVASVFVTLQPPGGGCDQLGSDSFAPVQERSGAVEFPFDRFATVPGAWSVCHVDVCDSVFNCQSYNHDALAAAGFALPFQVTAEPDTTAPALLSLSVDPTSLSLVTGPHTVALAYRASDQGSGVASVSLTLDVPGSGCVLALEDSNAEAQGVLSLALGRFNAPPGEWAICRVQICDRVGNCTLLDQAALAGRQEDLSFLVQEGVVPDEPATTIQVGGDYAGRMIADNGISEDAFFHVDQSADLASFTGELTIAHSLCVTHAAVNGFVDNDRSLVGDAHSGATGLSFRLTVRGDRLEGSYVAGTDCLVGTVGSLVFGRVLTPTPTSTATPTRTRTPTRTATATSSPSPVGCAGDCNANGAVSIDEVIRAVNIALGSQDLTVCGAADRNHDGNVTIDEIVAAVNFALANCPS